MEPAQANPCSTDRATLAFHPRAGCRPREPCPFSARRLRTASARSASDPEPGPHRSHAVARTRTPRDGPAWRSGWRRDPRFRRACRPRHRQAGRRTTDRFPGTRNIPPHRAGLRYTPSTRRGDRARPRAPARWQWRSRARWSCSSPTLSAGRSRSRCRRQAARQKSFWRAVAPRRRRSAASLCIQPPPEAAAPGQASPLDRAARPQRERSRRCEAARQRRNRAEPRRRGCGHRRSRCACRRPRAGPAPTMREHRDMFPRRRAWREVRRGRSAVEAGQTARVRDRTERPSN